jgi:hypothetical protein
MKFLPLVFAALLLFAFSANAQTNDLSKAEVQGRQLVQEILQQNPTEDLTNTGVLEVRSAHDERTKIPIRFQINVTKGENSSWSSIYGTQTTNGRILLIIVHSLDAGSNSYLLWRNAHETWWRGDGGTGAGMNEGETVVPFADSDFWIADLGLEFFHWPDQKVIKHESRRTRACAVLESTNPNPSAGGYSKVDTWIDNETLGIVHAEAYDANGKLLKIFDPKSFKKVNGQWELQDMEIRNVQTGSRTVIKFDLNSGA